MSQHCDIQLERPSGVYFSGETVNGHIYLTLTERALLKAIALEANGYASSSWLKPQKQKKSKAKDKPQVVKPPIAFEKRVDYFAKVDYFMGSEEAHPQLMDAGTYRYDFSVQLPPSCPSSYEGPHGHIRYTLQLMLHRSTNQTAEVALLRPLQVLQRCDSLPAQLTAPCEVQTMEQTATLKFWQRPMQLQLDIPRSGYEPGACISLHVRLANPQQLKLKMLTYKLNLVSTYVGQQKDKPKRAEAKVDRRYLVSSSHQLNNVARHELHNFQHLHTLQVPQTPATLSAAACTCLQLSYEVEVMLQTTSPERFIMAQIPIIVSNPMSMQDGLKQPPFPRSQFDLPGMGVASAPNQTPEPDTFAMGAPNLSQSMSSLTSNFREAEFMVATNLNKKDKHAMSGENIDFRPRYLYYEMEHAETEKVL
ncbi:arrestin domain-containing protein 4 isoform X2 [Drosophila innubila]|uniref:arrestin domain-containing protein 4 isoform X2 n=1 Tax=Drosophila innubila TaxID=198719 RepID=UPI00148CE3AA|nr:arrestin domain-containing protein 4 isoform X2 [Drosophila innubila]